MVNKEKMLRAASSHRVELLAKLCHKYGISELKVDTIEIKLATHAFKSNLTPKVDNTQQPIQNGEEVSNGEEMPSDDEMLNWSTPHFDHVHTEKKQSKPKQS